MVRRTRGVLVGLALAIAGCGGSDGGSGGVPTSVPGDKRIADLTPAERDKLCADVAAWAMSGPFLTDGCNASAWLATSLLGGLDPAATDASLRTMCETLYAQCVAGGVTANCDDQVPSTCTATVSEYNMCLSDSVDALGALPPCSSVTRASLASALTILTSQPTTAACMSVESQCPGAI
jgi:hypothetical protein